MYIKQIIIQGFKTYKDQTVIEPFSPHHNVIVGRNGSGKSNFFYAIRFVLSDAYTNLSREERQGLLHEGTGPATMSAYVEIIFDNSDHRFPTVGDDVVLRRTIGLKKDEYSLNRKTVTKSDVMSLLESAGFSRSNPYYIVPQGRITALCNAKDEERLSLLKEVAGTSVYETRKIDSLKIIEETSSKRQRIDELLQQIETRLNDLEEEKKDLLRYQEFDKEKRSLEYTIYSRELNEANESLENLEEEKRKDADVIATLVAEQANRENRITDLEKSMEKLRNQKNRFIATKAALENEKNEKINESASANVALKSLREECQNVEKLKLTVKTELDQITNELVSKEKRFQNVTLAYEECLKEEYSISQNLKKAEETRKEFFSKSSRLSQFRTKNERDKWIKDQLKSLRKSLANQQSQVDEMKNDEEDLKKKKRELCFEIDTSKNLNKEQQEEFESLKNEFKTLRQRKDEIAEKRQELWREEASIEAVISELNDDFRRAKRNLYQVMDKFTSLGLQAVTRIAQKYNIKGLYGPLYDLFEVEEDYMLAVEVVAGGSLFHLVVDNDETASKLLHYMNKERSGRVTFMPLNRLSPGHTVFPESDDAIPLISVIRYNKEFDKALNQVFGKAVICPYLEVASAYARNHNLTAVTLEGDRADRKGALTGGYRDTRQSRFDIIKEVKSYQNRLKTEEKKLVELKKLLAEENEEFQNIVNLTKSNETRRRQLQESRLALVEEIKSKEKDQERIDSLLNDMALRIRTAEGSIELINTKKLSLENELESDMEKTLSKEEEEAIQFLNVDIEKMKNDLILINTKRSTIEAEKSILDNEIHSHLKARKEELQQKMETLDVPFESQLRSSEQVVNEKEKLLEQIQKRLEVIESGLIDLENKSDEISTELAKTEIELNKEQEKQQKEAKLLLQFQKQGERFLSKKNMIVHKKEETTKNIRDLGILPEEAFEKYQSFSSSALLKKLHHAKEELKKYSHVNKKAFEQYTNFTLQQETLFKRKDELDKSSKAIHDLIQVLDHRKNEAIQRTFQQVSKNFSSVYEQLVPAGKGELLIQRKASTMSSGDLDPSSQDIEQFTGISIKVSFNSKSDEGLRMQQLSGGQKSLVALTFIFAIQQCDPAPFYLFDEIDANLDGAYRHSVAKMIQELSRNAQFITTTFRPELLSHADKFYGVSFHGKVSKVQLITKDDAIHFVEQEH